MIETCSVPRCATRRLHHHLEEVDFWPTVCDGRSDDYDRYLYTCCYLGPLLKPNPAPHGPGEPCTCKGCWSCTGEEVGCTCDIDWDELYERNRPR